MAVMTNEATDVIRDIHDLDERERASAIRRWIQLSELVAPRSDAERTQERTGN